MTAQWIRPIERPRDFGGSLRERRRGGPALTLIALFGLGAALGCGAQSGEASHWPDEACRARIVVTPEQSVQQQLVEAGGGRAHAQRYVPAAEIEPGRQTPVESATHLGVGGRPVAWLSVALDAVVVDAAAFAPLRPVDVAAIPPGERWRVGRVTPAGRRALGERGVFELLVRAEIVRALGEAGGELCLQAENDEDERYRAIWAIDSGGAVDVEIDPVGVIELYASTPIVPSK